MHLGPFGWLTKLDENRPKWCKSSCHEALSEFFATNAPVPPHWTLNSCVWCISYNFGAFGTVWLTYETRCKTGRTGTKVRGTKSHRNFSKWTHPIHPIGPQTHVLVHFVQLWCIGDRLVDLSKLGAKQAKLVQKFMPRGRVRIFHNERTRSNPLDSKHMFWYVLYYLDEFGTVWLP